MIAMDNSNAIRKAIPISLYEGLGFTKKSAVASNGYLRFYRVPEFYIKYTGAGTTAAITNTGVTFDITTDVPADNLVLDYITYPTIADLVTAIDGHGSYECYYTGTDDTQASTILYQYTAQEIIGELNYRNAVGRDVMAGPAPSVLLLTGYSASVNNLIFSTMVNGTIAAGDSTTPQITAQCQTTGPDGNIGINALDTLNGQGFLVSQNVEVEHAINDSSFANGSAEETDQEQAERFQATIQGLNDGTLNAMVAETLEVSGIRSVSYRDSYPGPGFVTLVADNGSGVLTLAQIDEINKRMYGDINDIENYPGVRPAGITIAIVAPVVVPINFTIAIYRIGELSDPTQITTTVQTVVEQYVNTRKLGDDMVLSELVKRIKASHPAIYDVVITLPVANVPANEDGVVRTGAGVGATITVTITTYTVKP